MAAFRGDAVKLFGSSLKVGDSAPSVQLVGKDLSAVQVGGAQGVYQIINVVPSLDTGVCAVQARTFNQKAASLPNAKVFVVSVDLPFAQGRFCSTEGIENLIVASDFIEKEFGKKYGLLLESSPLRGVLTRAVIVVDPQGKVAYQEICDEITNEPNYDNALNAVK
ncbi:thiol peroxidase [Helicobacter himalayensis]|uniref:thiol peroxidase n=1 Tax=Helicobacter himalayensis TaxID=1591088 RepID=UPI003D6FFAEC